MLVNYDDYFKTAIYNWLFFSQILLKFFSLTHVGAFIMLIYFVSYAHI